MSKRVRSPYCCRRRGRECQPAFARSRTGSYIGTRRARQLSDLNALDRRPVGGHDEENGLRSIVVLESNEDAQVVFEVEAPVVEYDTKLGG